MHQSSQIMDSLHLSQLDATSQIQNETYSCQRFIQTLMDLHQQTILFYCQYDQDTLADFYYQIAANKHMESLDEQTVRSFIYEIKDRNRDNLSKQIDFYEGQMRDLLGKKIEKISRKQFRKITDRYYCDCQLLTEILIENAQNADYIQCQKVIDLINEVKMQIQQPIQLGLTINKLKTRRLTQSQYEDDPKHSEIIPVQVKNQSKIFDGLNQLLLKTLINNYFHITKTKIKFYKQFIADDEIRDDIDNYLEQSDKQFADISDEVTAFITCNKELTKQCQRMQQVYEQLKEQQELYEGVVDQQKQQIAEFKSQIDNIKKQNQNYLNQKIMLETTVHETKSNIIKISEEYEHIQGQLINYKRSYNQLYTQYERINMTSTQNSLLKKEQETRKIFTDRSLKEQLEDTVSKLQRLLNQREKQKKTNQQKQEQQINRIYLLQANLLELEKELKQKNQYLNAYIRQTKRVTYQDGSLIQLSKISQNSRSSICRVSIDSRNFEFGQNVKSKYSNKNIPINTYMKKLKNKVCLAAVQPIQQIDELSDFIQSSELHQQQNITDIIQIDAKTTTENSSSKSINESFKKNSKVDQVICEENIGSPNSNKSPNKQTVLNQPKLINFVGHFASKGTLINHYGLKFQTTILLTTRRFCYFDTKVRLQKFLPIKNIKSFVFCFTNPCMFVIRPKNIKQLKQKKHIMSDMIFTLRNRSHFVNFISKTFLDVVTFYKIELSIKKQEDMFISAEGKQLNLKLKIPGINNPFRLALSQSPVYYGKFYEEGLFNRYRDCCLIVQPAGIFCFEANPTYEIQQVRQFVFFLPIVESMKVKEKLNSTEAQGRKLKIYYSEDKSWEKIFKLIFSNKQDLKRFLKSVEAQKERNLQTKLNIAKLNSKLIEACCKKIENS